MWDGWPNEEEARSFPVKKAKKAFENICKKWKIDQMVTDFYRPIDLVGFMLKQGFPLFSKVGFENIEIIDQVGQFACQKQIMVCLTRGPRLAKF